MDKFVIDGRRKLKGGIKISGAKNGSLALMPATILAPGSYLLRNTPKLSDVRTMSRLLDSMGIKSDLNGSDLTIDTGNISKYEAPYEHVKKMRASFYVLGPLLGRYGKAKVSLPGGCAWGPRPVDLHLKGLRKLGAEIDIESGYVIAKGKNLHGAKIHLDISSVGATGNILMGAILAKGTTLITNAATEPEIEALADFLIKMGAKIEGLGTNRLEIEGVSELKPVDETTIPDRIEAATYLVAAAMTRGNVKLTEVNPIHLTSVIEKLIESGCEIHYDDNSISLKMNNAPQPVDINTAVYPGFPTDVQAQWTVYMLLANGTSRITDNIYFDRFKHVPEMQRLGADIDVVENTALVRGSNELSGATVMSSDLRASASLILAALVAKGTTEVLRIYHIDRGYESIEKKLSSLGASIKRVKTEQF